MFHRRKLIALSCLTLVLVIFHAKTHFFPYLFDHNANSKNAYLHLVIPASTADKYLCKTLFSAAVMGYPRPTLINWNKEFNNELLSLGGSHLAKLSGSLEYLKNLGPNHDYDLVIMVDGLDVWFQFPPHILIQRYHDINRRANSRLGSRLGSSTPIYQNIVFSSQRRCAPHEPDDISCFALPNSTLSSTIYGPDTDILTNMSSHRYSYENPYLNVRPRFLNSGFVMGPVSSLRSLFALAIDVAAKDPHGGSDQGILGEILGAQEYQRKELSLRSSESPWSQFLNYFRGPEPRPTFLDHPNNKSQNVLLASDIPSEFHIGIDYASELAQTTVLSDQDADWVLLSDPSTIASSMAARNISHSLTFPLPPDLSSTAPPFSGIVSFNSSFPRAGWGEIPLYTNLWTGMVPGVIHHNAYQNDLKNLRDTLWERMWWQPFARELLADRIGRVREPVAIVEERRECKIYWSAVEKGGGVRTDSGEWIGLGEMCGEFEEELFMDGVEERFGLI